MLKKLDKHTIDLAVCIASLETQQQPARADEIGKVLLLSRDYVITLVSALKKAGIVTTVRGLKGGYRLSKQVDGITLGDIVRATGGDRDILDKPTTKALRETLCKATDSFMDELGKVTVGDVVTQFKRMNSKVLKEVREERK